MTVAVTGKSPTVWGEGWESVEWARGGMGLSELVGVVRAMSVRTCMRVDLSGSVGHCATSKSLRVSVGCQSLWESGALVGSEGLCLWCVRPLDTDLTPCSVPTSQTLLPLLLTVDLCPLLPSRPHPLPLGDRQPDPWVPRSGRLRLPVSWQGQICGTLSKSQSWGLYQARFLAGEPPESNIYPPHSFIPGLSALLPNPLLAPSLPLPAGFRNSAGCWRL